MLYAIIGVALLSLTLTLMGNSMLTRNGKDDFAGASGQHPPREEAQAPEEGARPNVRLVLTLPQRVVQALDMTAEQQAQVQRASANHSAQLLDADMQKDRAVDDLLRTAMSEPLDPSALERSKQEVIAAHRRRVEVKVGMYGEMRRALTAEQLERLQTLLPLERNNMQFVIQLPESLGEVGVTREQERQIHSVVRGSEPRMMAINRREQEARLALERALFAPQYDAALVAQRERELTAAMSENVDLSVDILNGARAALTPEQLRRLNELSGRR